MVLQKIGGCRLAVRLVRCHPDQQLVHLAVGEGAFRKIGKGIGRAFCEILNGHGVNGRGRVHCRLRCLALCLRDAIFKMSLINAAAEIDFNHLVFAEDGGRCPVIAEPGLLALVCLCERTVEARGGAWVDQLKSCVRELQRREEVAARDLAVPTGGTADEAGLRRVFGMLKSFACFLTPAMVASSGISSTMYFGTQKPSSPPSERDFPAMRRRFSSMPFCSASAKELVQSSGAISGSPFSIIEVPVGIVSPVISSASQP